MKYVALLSLATFLLVGSCKTNRSEIKDDIPANNIGFRLGNGYDSYKAELRGLPCIAGTTTRTKGGNAKLEIVESISAEGMFSNLTANADFGLKIPIITADMGGKSVNSHTTDNYSRSISFILEVPILQEAFIEDTVHAPTPKYIVDDTDPNNVMRPCGDQYINKVVYGVKLFATMKFDFLTKDDAKEFDMHFSINSNLKNHYCAPGTNTAPANPEAPPPAGTNPGDKPKNDIKLAECEAKDDANANAGGGGADEKAPLKMFDIKGGAGVNNNVKNLLARTSVTFVATQMGHTERFSTIASEAQAKCTFKIGDKDAKSVFDGCGSAMADVMTYAKGELPGVLEKALDKVSDNTDPAAAGLNKLTYVTSKYMDSAKLQMDFGGKERLNPKYPAGFVDNVVPARLALVQGYANKQETLAKAEKVMEYLSSLPPSGTDSAYNESIKRVINTLQGAQIDPLSGGKKGGVIFRLKKDMEMIQKALTACFDIDQKNAKYNDEPWEDCSKYYAGDKEADPNSCVQIKDVLGCKIAEAWTNIDLPPTIEMFDTLLGRIVRGSDEVVYKNFAVKQPDNFLFMQDCVSINDLGDWDDDYCDFHPKFKFACRNSNGNWLLSDKEGAWNEHKHACSGGFFFATPANANENNTLKALLAAKGVKRVWISYNDTKTEGRFTSSTQQE
ncbi:MAG: hypothetical protein AB7T49_08910 [Oligoflexales bacterium]